MNILELFFLSNYQAIIISKIILKPSNDLPKIIKLVIFIIVHLKYYKKKMLLFYIIINLFFSNNTILKNNEICNYQILKFSIKCNFFILFFYNFINVYLPTLNSEQNVQKQIISNKKYPSPFLIYTINYLNFPTIPESELFCYNNESLAYFINNTRLQLSIYIKSFFFLKNSLEILIRIFKFPYIFRCLYSQTKI
jgi:hypothetical protein